MAIRFRIPRPYLDQGSGLRISFEVNLCRVLHTQPFSCASLVPPATATATGRFYSPVDPRSAKEPFWQLSSTILQKWALCDQPPTPTLKRGQARRQDFKKFVRYYVRENVISNRRLCFSGSNPHCMLFLSSACLRSSPQQRGVSRSWES